MVQIEKRSLIALLVFVIVADLIFIAGTWFWYSEDTNKIWEYVRVRQYADKIEEMYPGKVKVYYIENSVIYLEISPEITLEECSAIAQNFQNWRIHDSALYDFTKLSMFPTDVYIGCPSGLSMRSVVLFSYDKNSGDIVDIYLPSGEFLSFLGSELCSYEGSKLSSFRVLKDTFSISTEVFIDLDDESIFSKMTEWQCRAGLYTEDELADIETRGIPVTTWGEEDAA